MSIIQTFYDQLASQYDKLFQDWPATVREQAAILDRIFKNHGFGTDAHVLDCACGIGTQAIGIALLGYDVSASDISRAELAQARERAEANGARLRFFNADFCALDCVFSQQFDIIMAIDNALPHMLTHEALASATCSIIGQLADGGIFVASIRDYDALLADKPPYSAPCIHETGSGQRVSFQTWNWSGDTYRLIQYIIEDEDSLQISKFECQYRATRRAEMTDLLTENGCSQVVWLFPEETGFYQPIVVARK